MNFNLFVKRSLLAFALFLSSLSAYAEPIVINIKSGGYDREYLLYIPKHYNENNPADLIVCLHGFNRTMHDFFEAYNILTIADSLNLIVLAPQALSEQDPEVLHQAENLKDYGIDIPLDAAWSCGLKVKATFLGFLELLNVELNKNVDDVAFIEAIINEAKSNYYINNDNTFIFGTSLGGFMSYQYALYNGNDLSGLISICGSMGNNIKNENSDVNIPICDFHSVDDEVVPYSGLLSFNSLIEVSLCQEKEKVITDWVSRNNALTLPSIENINYYPATSGYTVTKYTYPEKENEVIHYKITGAKHSYYFKKENDCMDYNEEVYKFIKNHTKEPDTKIEPIANSKLAIYPNPVRDQLIHINIDEGNASIYDLNGKLIFTSKYTGGSLQIPYMRQGIYILNITSSLGSFHKKILIE